MYNQQVQHATVRLHDLVQGAYRTLPVHPMLALKRGEANETQSNFRALDLRWDEMILWGTAKTKIIV